MHGWMQGARTLAWVALAAVTGVLVHAEVLRPEVPEGVRVYKDMVYRHVGFAGRGLTSMSQPRARLRFRAGRRSLRFTVAGGMGGRRTVTAERLPGWHSTGTLSSRSTMFSPVRAIPPGLTISMTPAKLCDGFVATPATMRLTRPGSRPWASAGGHLAALLGTKPHDSDPESSVQAIIDFYGPTDLIALLPESWGGLTALALSRKDPRSGPPTLPRRLAALLHLADDAPALIFHGETDDLVPVSQSTDLADRLRSVGVPAEVIVVKGAGHSFGFEVQGRDLVPEILAFLDRSWKRLMK